MLSIFKRKSILRLNALSVFKYLTYQYLTYNERFIDFIWQNQGLITKMSWRLSQVKLFLYVYPIAFTLWSTTALQFVAVTFNKYTGLQSALLLLLRVNQKLHTQNCNKKSNRLRTKKRRTSKYRSKPNEKNTRRAFCLPIVWSR